uniref:Uncharacterized protein n=1 Tax=Panagrolaimus sp. JU765 TaxID=591449 RepID=A0AC34R1B9_9BILA
NIFDGNDLFATPNSGICERTYVVSRSAHDNVPIIDFTEDATFTTPFIKKQLAPDAAKLLENRVKESSQEAKENFVEKSRNVNTVRRVGINLATPPRTPQAWSKKLPTAFVLTPRLEKLAEPKRVVKPSENPSDKCKFHRHRGPLSKFVDTTKMSKREHDEYLKFLKNGCSCCK